MVLKKQRLDIVVVENGLFDSRKEAQTAIMDGWILVNDEKITKPGTVINIDSSITIKSGFKKKRFVSRGGLKLEKALDDFAINVKGKICIDLGASTGGFTDCLLQRGAKKVFAVDVGYGQLAWNLRQDDRVVLKERQNARYLTSDNLYKADEPKAEFACVDCSFISLSKIVPVLPIVLNKEAVNAVCLVKPQFEAGKNQVDKGVVKDPKIHKLVLNKVLGFANQLNLALTKVTYSPVKGPKGNIEYLIQLNSQGLNIESFDPVIEQAFTHL